MLRLLIAIFGASMGIWNFLALVVFIFLLLAAFGGSMFAWVILGIFAAVFMIMLLHYAYSNNITGKAHRAWMSLPKEVKDIWEGISIDIDTDRKYGGLWLRGEEPFKKYALKRANILDWFRSDFEKNVPFPKENWMNSYSLYVSDEAKEKMKKLGYSYGESDSNYKVWLAAAIVAIVGIALFCFYLGQQHETTPARRPLTPEELRVEDSLRQAYRKEQDSIKYAQKKEHEEYIRKMARDIVNSGRSSSRSDNMRGWDPASEDDLEENGMDRYMENNDEEGWD